MAKIKVIKKLPKQNKNYKRKVEFKLPAEKQDKFKENYLQFYDDIKIPSKKHDW